MGWCAMIHRMRWWRGQAAAAGALLAPNTPSSCTSCAPAAAGHGRLPLLQLLDEAPEAAAAPPGVPMHTGLGFWTARDADGVVSKLRFPRYAHVIRWEIVGVHDVHLIGAALVGVMVPGQRAALPSLRSRGQVGSGVRCW